MSPALRESGVQTALPVEDGSKDSSIGETCCCFNWSSTNWSTNFRFSLVRWILCGLACTGIKYLNKCVFLRLTVLHESRAPRSWFKHILVTLLQLKTKNSQREWTKWQSTYLSRVRVSFFKWAESINDLAVVTGEIFVKNAAQVKAMSSLNTHHKQMITMSPATSAKSQLKQKWHHCVQCEVWPSIKTTRLSSMIQVNE